jgi:6,7-dimethyl-8-ribityllumazine synthase
MLKPVRSRKVRLAKGRFAIVASRYNARYVDAMVKAAQAELKRAGVKPVVIRVPGAFEVPVVAAKLASQGRSNPGAEWSAIICLGVILRGATAHAAHIGEAVSAALMRIQVDFQVPVIHEVLLLENEEQARVRCLGPTHNRGTEAGQTALAMAEVMAEVMGENGMMEE